jgi:hypothetical protein
MGIRDVLAGFVWLHYKDARDNYGGKQHNPNHDPGPMSPRV